MVDFEFYGDKSQNHPDAKSKGGKTAKCTVTVTNATVKVTGVKLNSTSKTLNTGSSFNLTATVSPSNATNKGVSWSSSNTSVATVSGGKVTAKKAGTATITVKTSDGGKTAVCNIIVKAVVNIYPRDKIKKSDYVYSILNCKWTSNIGPENREAVSVSNGTITGNYPGTAIYSNFINQTRWVDIPYYQEVLTVNVLVPPAKNDVLKSAENSERYWFGGGLNATVIVSSTLKVSEKRSSQQKLPYYVYAFTGSKDAFNSETYDYSSFGMGHILYNNTYLKDTFKADALYNSSYSKTDYKNAIINSSNWMSLNTSYEVSVSTGVVIEVAGERDTFLLYPSQTHKLTLKG